MEVSVSIKETGKKGKQFDLSTDFSGKLIFEEFLDFMVSAQITVAKDVLKEEQGKGFDKEPRKRIDNKFDLVEEAVKPFGKIEYFARQSFIKSLVDAYDLIVKQSKHVTGAYKKFNFVFYNGSIVARSKRTLIKWITTAEFESGDKIRFANLTPYARRLEYLGVRSRTSSTRSRKASKKYSKKFNIAAGVKVRKPNGAYYNSYREILRNKLIRSSFNKVKFEFLPGNYIGIGAERNRVSGWRTSFKKDNRPYLYPTILLTYSSSGDAGGKIQ